MLVDLSDVVFLREGVGHALLQLALVAAVIEQYGIGTFPVTPCAARLLEIGFDAVGTVDVYHHPYVGLVDTHAKGIGGYHHPYLVFLPGLLALILHAGVETGMIESGRDACL